MKKWIVLILLLFSVSVYAGNLIVGIGGMGTSGGGISCDDADQMCQSFEDGSVPSGWSETETGGTITWTNSSFGSCSDKGTYSVRIAKTAQQAIYTNASTASEVSTMYFQVYIDLVAESLSAAEYDNIAFLKNGSSLDAARISLVDVAGTPKIRCSYYNGHGISNTDKSTIDLTTNSGVHRIRLVWIAATSISFQVDDETAITVSEGVGDRDIAKIYFGNTDAGNEDAWTIDFDLLKMDDDNAPASCGS